jgi:Ca2+-binding RTX toxin-like protein
MLRPITVAATSGVLWNDSDADNDTKSVFAVTGLSEGTVGQPVATAHGTLTLDADGSFVYTPDVNFIGTDSFTYQETDGLASSGTVSVSLQIVGPDIDISSFLADGQNNVQINYSVLYTPTSSFKVSVYISHDGTSLDQEIWRGDGGTSLGTYTLSFQPTYDDWQDDHYLVAVVDSDNGVAELDETNNTARFHGAFLNQINGQTILEVHGTDTADSIEVSTFTYQQEYQYTETEHHDARTVYLEHVPDLWVPDIHLVCPGIRDEEGNCDQDLVEEDDGQLVPQPPIEHEEPCDGCEEVYYPPEDVEVTKTGYRTQTAFHLTMPQTYADAVDYYMTIDQITIRSHAGDDILTASGASAWLFGGADNDTITGATDYADYLDGADGNDSLAGGNSDDTLIGGDGNDTIIANAGDDSLDGGDGTDSLDGGDGNDSLDGGSGNDILNGDAGDDTLIGGDGNDSLDGGDGYDTTFPDEPAGGQMSANAVQVSLDMSRIIDVAMDNSHCVLQPGYDGCRADERYVLVTLDGPDGFSMSEIRSVPTTAEVTGGTGGVTFPISGPYTDYTLTVTGIGLNVDRVPDPFNAPLSFNSSAVPIDGQGHVEFDFDVTLSSGVNRNPDGSVPTGFHIPNAGDPFVQAHNHSYTVLAGAVLEVSAEGGLLPDAIDAYNDSWTSFSASGGGAQHGTATLNSDGSFTYIPNHGFWGEDYFRFTVSAAGKESLKATVYISIGPACNCDDRPGDDSLDVDDAPVDQNCDDVCQPAVPAKPDIDFPGIVEANPKITDESTRVDKLGSDKDGVLLGHVNPSPPVSFALERYDAPDGSGKCGVRILTMTMGVDIKLADGAQSPTQYIALTQAQKAAVVAHEKVHRNAFVKHFADVRDMIRPLDAAVQMLPAGPQQKTVAGALATKYTTKIASYLSQMEIAEAKRQKFHLDQLAESRWDMTNTTVFLSPTKTYRDAVTLADLKAAFPWLGADVTTIDGAVQAISQRLADEKANLQAQINADIALIGRLAP